MNFNEQIDNLYHTMKEHRKVLNPIAETGFEEFRTSRYIRSVLDKNGISYETIFNTGTIGYIKKEGASKTIAFRADIDGLKTEGGIKHLCGHDGHTSILLGLSELLKKNEDILNFNFVFIFQPAEEGPGGAEKIVDSGLFEKYGIDEIYGLHLYPEIPEGSIGIRSGYFLSQIGDVDIDIKAKSCHGAMPQNGKDGILAASELIMMLQSVVSRNVSPIDNAVLSMGKIEGGARRNIVAETVRIEGTIRCFGEEVYNMMKNRLNTVAQGVALANDIDINVEIRDDYLSVDNDEELTQIFIQAVEEKGEIEVRYLDPLMISEDFSYYQRKVPGVFYMLGCGNREKGYVNSLHNLNFNFDEIILPNALKVYMSVLEKRGAFKDMDGNL